MNRMGGVWKDGVALAVLPLKSKTSSCQRWLERQRWSQKRPEGREKEDDKGLEGKTKQKKTVQKVNEEQDSLLRSSYLKDGTASCGPKTWRI